MVRIPREQTPRHGKLAAVQKAVIDVARTREYHGYSKHDALNARWLERISGRSRILRLACIQLVMRCPFHVRPSIRVRTFRNPKGLALFARALLSRTRHLHESWSALEARRLLDTLLEISSPGYPWLCWGYPYPWQDVGFFASRDTPNRVVTSFVVQALLDGFETLGESRYVDAAGEAVAFLLNAPGTLYEDEGHRCVSYVPLEEVTWRVVDVPALSGAAAARYAALVGDGDLMREAGRLLRWVVSRQTDSGAWYYADPPSASHITHDNYHTGFILDSILTYGACAGTDEFDSAYRSGLDFYRERLFEPDGAPRFMHDRRYPHDIHGAAQGVITFALAARHVGDGCQMSRKILLWTLANMYERRTNWFLYQKRRFYRTRIRLLRWCQAWMAWAIACHLESCGELP